YGSRPGSPTRNPEAISLGENHSILIESNLANRELTDINWVILNPANNRLHHGGGIALILHQMFPGIDPDDTRHQENENPRAGLPDGAYPSQTGTGQIIMHCVFPPNREGTGEREQVRVLTEAIYAAVNILRNNPEREIMLTVRQDSVARIIQNALSQSSGAQRPPEYNPGPPPPYEEIGQPTGFQALNENTEGESTIRDRLEQAMRRHLQGERTGQTPEFESDSSDEEQESLVVTRVTHRRGELKLIFPGHGEPAPRYMLVEGDPELGIPEALAAAFGPEEMARIIQYTRENPDVTWTPSGRYRTLVFMGLTQGQRDLMIRTVDEFQDDPDIIERNPPRGQARQRTPRRPPVDGDNPEQDPGWQPDQEGRPVPTPRGRAQTPRPRPQQEGPRVPEVRPFNRTSGPVPPRQLSLYHHHGRIHERGTESVFTPWAHLRYPPREEANAVWEERDPHWYYPTEWDRHAASHGPSSSEILEHRGITEPFKRTMLARGYDYYREGCRERDRSVERRRQAKRRQQEAETARRANQEDRPGPSQAPRVSWREPEPLLEPEDPQWGNWPSTWEQPQAASTPGRAQVDVIPADPPPGSVGNHNGRRKPDPAENPAGS
ncbi:hypothetical protein GOODEAATRI_021941, partial [Goodea atripinnis]